MLKPIENPRIFIYKRSSIQPDKNIFKFNNRDYRKKCIDNRKNLETKLTKETSLTLSISKKYYCCL